MKTIKIEGRGVTYSLAKFNDHSYMMPEVDYIRFSADEDGTVYFIDPPNGPFIHIDDYVIDGKIVKHIYFDEEQKRFILQTI